MTPAPALPNPYPTQRGGASCSSLVAAKRRELSDSSSPFVFSPPFGKPSKRPHLDDGPEGVVEMDKREGVVLMVGRGEAATRFRVCTHAFAQTSPLLEHRLFPAAAKALPDHLELLDEDPVMRGWSWKQ